MRLALLLLPAAVLALPACGGDPLGPDERAIELLRRPPFAPTDVHLLTPHVYPDAPALAPAPDPGLTEPDALTQLTAALEQRFGAGDPRVDHALAVYHDRGLDHIIADFRIRAALVYLAGTAGEAAIGAVQEEVYSEIRFGGTPPGHPVARTHGAGSAVTRQVIVLSDRYEHEDPRLVASLLAHETLHRDPRHSPKEELITDAVSTLVYGQLLLETPALAVGGTELARRQNTQLMARLNSRDEQGNLRLLVSRGEVYPGGAPRASFGAGFELDVPSTPGSVTLRAALQAVTGEAMEQPDFDDATLALLDQRQVLLAPAEVVELARILELDVPE